MVPGQCSHLRPAAGAARTERRLLIRVCHYAVISLYFKKSQAGILIILWDHSRSVVVKVVVVVVAVMVVCNL